MERLIETVILGIIQGLTEWLPISSTGHLRLFENLLNFEVPILYDVILHVGTLVVILVYFRRDIAEMLSSFVRPDSETKYGRAASLIFVAVVPTALIGYVFGGLIEDTFQAFLSIGVAFLCLGTVLYASKLGNEKSDTISYSTALMIGLAQGIAIIPGISRSGATISIALLLGVEQKEAFRFSFLISIPAILGALTYAILKESGKLIATGLGWVEILTGTFIAMMVGYFSLQLLWRTLSRRKFHLFSAYCWLLGIFLVLIDTFQPFWPSG
ncbi:undecaprenyl-diphosphatase UppP [Candidatus Bathyarchaeota archaeon]|nr:undecaprenyl-diphosphatase UppP [Candidatus Bathyarchaeota archaeon]